MTRSLSILVMLAVVSMPVLSAIGTRCGGCGPSARDDAATTVVATSCCALPATAHDRQSGERVPGDDAPVDDDEDSRTGGCDCPAACCRAFGLTAQPPVREAIPAWATSRTPSVPAAIARIASPAHLDRLHRPPRPAAAL